MNAEQLRQIAALAGLSDESLKRLAAALEQKDYRDGEVIFAEGSPGDSMYFLAEGHVRIEKQAAANRHKVLAVLEAGDYFGEMALFDQKPRSGFAVAVGTTKTLRLCKQAFDELQSRSSVVGLNLLFAMLNTSSQRIRRLSNHLVVYDEVGKAIGEARDLQGLLDVILQQLVSATGADWGLMLLRAQFSERFEVRSQVNLDLNEAQREAISTAQGFVSVLLRNPQEQLVEDLASHQSYKSCVRLGFETPSMLLSPIMLEKEMLGLIVLGAQAPGDLDLNALNLCKGVGRQAAQAILNARHREEQAARSRHSRQFVRF
jgi:CRP/FNR family transcriptional regulator, cyclic AMP receptor protein